MRENTDQKSSEYGHFSPSSYDKGSTASVFAFSIKITLSSEVKCDFFKMSTSPTKILHILRKINNYLWIWELEKTNKRDSRCFLQLTCKDSLGLFTNTLAMYIYCVKWGPLYFAHVIGPQPAM